MAARSTVVRHAKIIIVPTTFKEADSEMCQLQDINQAIADAEAKLAADIARLREQTKANTARLRKERVRIEKGLIAWAKLNYRRIILRRDKSLRFMYGAIKYQNGRYRICPDPPKVRERIVDSFVDVNPA